MFINAGAVMVAGILFNNHGHRRHPGGSMSMVKKNLQVTAAIVIFANRNKTEKHYVKVH